MANRLSPGHSGLNSHLPPAKQDVQYPINYPDRPRTRGYWISLLFCCLIGSVTPLSIIYLAWFFSKPDLTFYSTSSAAATLPVEELHSIWRPLGLWILGFYALLEVTFFIYQLFLISFIQTPSPPSTLSNKACQKLFLRVLQSGLGEQQGQALTRAAVGREGGRRSTGQEDQCEREGEGDVGGGGSRDIVEAGGEELLQRLLEREDMEVSRRHSKQKQKQRSTSLRPGNEDDGQNGEGVKSPQVWVTRLDQDDERAIEFRERLRNWFGRVPWHTISRQDALTWLSWSCFNLPLASERYAHQPSSRRMSWKIRLEVLLRMAPTLSFMIQLVLIAFGEWQDRNSAVKYTDVDYRVFSDAVGFLWNGGDKNRAQGWLTEKMNWNIGDPYARATFRYTPLLPVLLLPMQLLPGALGPTFGKLVFSALSSFVVPALLTSSELGASRRSTHLLWTLNPMILNINTRGSSEVVLATLVLGALVLLKKGNLVTAGSVWALSVHWKLYPIIFAASIWRFLSVKNGGKWVTASMIRFGLASAACMGVLTGVCWSIWGYPFLQHTYLYHIDRLDHRHNFSAYFYPIYLGMFDSSKSSPLSAFLPQITSTALAGLALIPGTSLEFAWFVQTYLFVMFNKVCTSQYFIWYLFLLPPIIGHLELSRKKGWLIVAAWVGSQALWLSIAFQLEFKAKNVHLSLWGAGLVFLVTNAWIISSLINSYDPHHNHQDKHQYHKGHLNDVEDEGSLLPSPISPVAGPGGQALLDWSYQLLESRTGTRFDEQGSDDELNAHIKQEAAERAKVMRLTLDPVNALPRPLYLYATALILNWILKNVVYPRLGYTVHKEGEMEYLLRIPPGWTPDSQEPSSKPIVYIHGLGFGMIQNHFIIHSLATKLPSHPIAIPLQPHISMNFTHKQHLNPLDRESTVKAITNICNRWKFHVPTLNCSNVGGDENTYAGRSKKGGCENGVILLSHSNGSIAHGWILRDQPCLVARSAFVDPVVFCLWEGDVCYNFCYRSPRTALELLLYYFIGSEVGIANTIQRHFDWSDNTIFFDEIPNASDSSKTMWMLGGEDIIIDAWRVKKYLEDHGVVEGEGICFDPAKNHGDGLTGKSLDQVMTWLSTGAWNGDKVSRRGKDVYQDQEVVKKNSRTG